jgi:hypothetical protein
VSARLLQVRTTTELRAHWDAQMGGAPLSTWVRDLVRVACAIRAEERSEPPVSPDRWAELARLVLRDLPPAEGALPAVPVSVADGG